MGAAEEMRGLLAGLVDHDVFAARHQLVLAVFPLHGDALPLGPLRADWRRDRLAQVIIGAVIHAILLHPVVSDGGPSLRLEK